jgi:putative transposase
MLPMGLGNVEGVTHDYVRHGTTTLFAALDIANGKMLTRPKPRHRHQEFLGYLRHIDKNVTDELHLHLVLDNYASHKHPKVKIWLLNHPRYHLHFTSTYSTWLNQVERWFGIITQRAICRGSLGSVKELVQKIDQFVSAYNEKYEPFGRKQWSQSSRRSAVCVSLFLGQNTSTHFRTRNTDMHRWSRTAGRAPPPP